MRPFPSLPIILFFAACAGKQASSTFPDGEWVDLTHPFDEQTIYWPTAETFRLDTVFEGITDGGFYYSAYQFCAAEHGGTHLDAPVHFSEGKNAVGQIPVGQLIGEAVVVDVSGKALQNPDYLVGAVDFEQWEQQNGQLPDGAIVLLRTGYGQFWPDSKKYLGTDERGAEAVAKLHFPGLDPQAAHWLATQRNIKAIGLDTPSIDFGQSTLFESHQVLFKHNIPAFENVAHLDRLPAKGSWVIALPMNIRHGSGAPLRIVALLP